jgi:hypothetical protein
MLHPVSDQGPFNGLGRDVFATFQPAAKSPDRLPTVV